MIEKILIDRKIIIEGYEEKLKKDVKKLGKHKKSEDQLVSKRALELENTITEVLSFISVYKKELDAFLQDKPCTMDGYAKTLSPYDEKFFEVLKFIQKKEEALKNIGA